MEAACYLTMGFFPDSTGLPQWDRQGRITEEDLYACVFRRYNDDILLPINPP